MARGHIVQRAQGSWTVVVSAGRDPESGKRRRIWRTVRGTKKQANEVMTALLAEFDRGITPGTGKLKLGDWLHDWLKDIVRHRNKPRTVQSYETIINTHIVPVLGNVTLHKLEPSHIDRLMAAVQNKGRSANTALHVFTVLRKALTDAERRGLVGRNVCRVAQAPHVDPYRVDVPDMSNIWRVLDVADEIDAKTGLSYGTIFRSAYHTGLRRGELLALRWQSVDLDTGVMAVLENLQNIKGKGLVVQSVKSAYSRRPVTLDGETVTLLRRHRARQSEHILKLGGAYDDRGFVFPDQLGRLLNPDSVTSAWRRAAKKAGFPNIRLHDLRHGHAEGLVRAGVHAKVVQERMGHASAAFTMQVYGHVAPGLQELAADAFAKLVSKAEK